MVDAELTILKTVVDTATILASEGDRDEALYCLVTGLGWASRACAMGRPRTEELIRRYARRWLARRRALRDIRTTDSPGLAAAAMAQVRASTPS